MLGSRRCCDQRGWGEGSICYLYAMYLMKVNLLLRQEQGYFFAQASTDRKAGRLSLPFYSVEYFGNTPIFFLSSMSRKRSYVGCGGSGIGRVLKSTI